MAGQATQTLELRYHRLEVFNRLILVIAVVALLAVAGMGAWIAADRFGQPDGEKLAQKLAAAWVAETSADLESVYAADAVLVASDGTTYNGLAEIQQAYANGKMFTFTPTVIGPVVQGDHQVAVPIRITMSNGQVAYVTSVLDLNSAGLITHHQDYGTH